MKAIFFFFLVAGSCLAAHAQNNVGIGTAAPHNSALLDLSSTGKGLLIPRMSSAQRTGIAAPAKGLLVFDNDLNQFYFFNGSSWTALAGDAAGPFVQSANAVHNSGNPTTLPLVYGRDSIPGNNEYVSGRFLFFDPVKGALRAGTVDDVDKNWSPALTGENSTALGNNNTASGSYSTALGNHNTSAGVSSLAAGDYNKTYGVNSVALGASNEAVANYSFAAGALNRTAGEVSATFGVRNVTKTHDAFVIGRFNDTSFLQSSGSTASTDPLFTVANGSGMNNRSNAFTIFRNGRLALGTNSPGSIAHIRGNSASGGFSHLKLEEADPGDYARLSFANADNNNGWTLAANSYPTNTNQAYFNFYREALGNVLSINDSYSFYMGRSNSWLPSNFSLIFGEESYTGNYGSMSFGYRSHSAGFWSIAMGSGAKSISRNAVALGEYNDTSNMTSSFNRVTTDPVLVVGNGFADNARSNALTILRNGRIGIGTVTPQYLLHTRGNSGSGSGLLVVEESESADGARVTFRNTARTSNYWDLYAFTATVPSQALFNIFNQGFGNVLSLRGDGIGYLAGNLILTSDARLKKDIEPVTGSMSKLQRINGYQYHWKNPGKDSTLQTGLLAQELEQTFPELVYTDAEGHKGVNYIGLIPHLLEAIKALNSKNESLENQIRELQTRR